MSEQKYTPREFTVHVRVGGKKTQLDEKRARIFRVALGSKNPASQPVAGANRKDYADAALIVLDGMIAAYSPDAVLIVRGENEKTLIDLEFPFVNIRPACESVVTALTASEEFDRLYTETKVNLVDEDKPAKVSKMSAESLLNGLDELPALA